MSQRANGFRTNYPRGAVLPSGELLNKYGGALTGLTPGYPTGAHSPYHGVANMSGTEAGLIVGIATITDGSNSCPIDRDTGEVGAPCFNLNKYSAVFRYYDSSTKAWLDRPTTLRVDASAYTNLLTGEGTVPTYEEGDSVPAYFDPQSLWCVPIHSPPNYPPYVSFIGKGFTLIPRANKDLAISVNSTEFSLELATRFSFAATWIPLAPRLILHSGEKEGAASGSITVHLDIKDNELLRLRCGTSFYSRADTYTAWWGMHIRFLAPSAGYGAAVPTLYSSGSDGFATLRGLTLNAFSDTRFDNGAQATTFGDFIRIRTPNEGVWVAAVTIWAEVRAIFLVEIVVVSDLSLIDEFGENSKGMLVAPNSEGLHSAVVVNDIGLGGEIFASDRDMRCWLAPLDLWYATEAERESMPLILEQGRTYGPTTYLGHVEVDGDDLPVYGIDAGTQGFPAKCTTTTGTTPMGQSAEFELYDGKKRASGIKVNAEARWNDIDNTKFAWVERINRSLVVNPLQC